MAIVCLTVTMDFLSKGGLYIVPALGSGFGMFVCIFSAFVSALNVGHAGMSRVDPDGTVWSAHKTDFGDGAAQSYSRWNMDNTPQVGGGDYGRLGDGQTR
jgi:hypothetical protein